MIYHIFTCKDPGSDANQALIVIADSHGDDLAVGRRLQDILRERGRSDLMHTLEARRVETTGPLNTVLVQVEEHCIINTGPVS